MLDKIPFIKNYFIDLDRNVKKYGLTEGFNKFLKKLNSRLIIDNLNKNNFNILSKKPCLVIATHPYQLEIFPAVACLPPRKDSFLVMTFELFGLCPNVDKNALPIYLKNSPIESYKEKFLNLWLKYFHQSESFEKDVGHQKNIETIAKAAKIINKGGSAIIFPDARGNNFSWKSGVGWLVNQIKNTNAYYIFVYNKAYLYDYFRFLYQVGRILPPLKVFLSDAEKISGLTKNKPDPKQITINLEKEYRSWVKNLA